MKRFGRSHKKPARKQAPSSDHLAQLITVIAVGMGVAYVVLRVVGWVRFTGV